MPASWCHHGYIYGTLEIIDPARGSVLGVNAKRPIVRCGGGRVALHRTEGGPDEDDSDR